MEGLIKYLKLPNHTPDTMTMLVVSETTTEGELPECEHRKCKEGEKKNVTDGQRDDQDVGGLQPSLSTKHGATTARNTTNLLYFLLWPLGCYLNQIRKESVFISNGIEKKQR